MKAAVILALPLMLSACWTGADFYSGVPSAQPIPAGKYKVTDVVSKFDRDKRRNDTNEPFAGDVGTKIRLAYAANGDVLIKGSQELGDGEHARLVPLDEARGLYVAEADPGQSAIALDARYYGLVQVIPNGYRLSVPPCDGARRIRPGSRAVISGLLVRGRVCSFTDRQTFESAMRKFAEDPSDWTEYRLIKG